METRLNSRISRAPTIGVEFFGRVPYSVVMSLTAEEIAQQALSLPHEARAQLGDRLVENLDPQKTAISASFGLPRRCAAATMFAAAL
jgi:hypothetical protein